MGPTHASSAGVQVLAHQDYPGRPPSARILQGILVLVTVLVVVAVALVQSAADEQAFEDYSTGSLETTVQSLAVRAEALVGERVHLQGWVRQVVATDQEQQITVTGGAQSGASPADTLVLVTASDDVDVPRGQQVDVWGVVEPAPALGTVPGPAFGEVLVRARYVLPASP